MGTKTYNDRQIDNFANRSLSMALAQAQARFTIYAWASIAYLPASCCDRKCIQNDLYAHVATRVQIILYALPVATLAQAYIVNRP